MISISRSPAWLDYILQAWKLPPKSQHGRRSLHFRFVTWGSLMAVTVLAVDLFVIVSGHVLALATSFLIQR